MSKVKDLKKQIQELSPEELTAFREWFTEFYPDTSDQEVDQAIGIDIVAIGGQRKRAEQADDVKGEVDVKSDVDVTSEAEVKGEKLDALDERSLREDNAGRIKKL